MPKPKKATTRESASYRHPSADLTLRPEVGTQAQFKKAKPAQKYRYDSSLSPSLDWDGQNPAREQGEEAINAILEAETLEQAKQAALKLKGLSQPFLNWTGKAERLSFDVPTLPLFVHERLSTAAIIQTLTGHKKSSQLSMLDLFADPQHSVADQVLRAYEHREPWVNRMMLGDSLVVMNSLLRYESRGGQVQMIYMDPPYGVKFGSNFQPFVRKTVVSANNDDEDMTREPEMVQAYRDTWEIGLHSYLTYLRDRLLLARELLTPTGSIFVQISDENLHHVREVMDEVFGAENFVAVISYQKTTSSSGKRLSSVNDYLVWFAKDKRRLKYNQLYLPKEAGETGGSQYTWAQMPDGSRKNFGGSEKLSEAPSGSRFFSHDNLTSQRPAQGEDVRSFDYEGKNYTLRKGTFKTDFGGLTRLAEARRLIWIGDTLRYVRFLDDFPVFPLSNLWNDTVTSGFASPKVYVVQTNPLAIQRCMLMTTDPGDLVLDPTCGSGTTAYVAEQWGRRWITCDTSRVPLALARQRLLTATFPWYELKDESLGPAAGFKFMPAGQSKNPKSVGPGIVPHIKLEDITNNEPPAEEVLVDRPEELKSITRVCGPFVVEASIPTAMDWDKKDEGEPHGAFASRMLEVLRKSPVLRLDGNNSVTFKNVRSPAKTLSLSAEALQVNGEEKPVAFVFGPENGAVVERLVYEAAREAHAKNYTHLYVIGFAIQPTARELIEKCADVVGVPATYVQATPDLLMGDLLKNMRSSQIFSVCGLPEIKVSSCEFQVASDGGSKLETDNSQLFQVELLGLDVFDPVTMEVSSKRGGDVPAWFLDTDYNGRVFHVNQAFFPRTSAWENLKKALKGDYDESVWDHLSGTVSAPFPPGEHREIAVKVIDDRGNELMVVKKLEEGK